MWPTIELERFPPSPWSIDYVKKLHEAVQEMQRILRGNIVLVSDTEEVLPNMCVGVTEVYHTDAVGADAVAVSNPIGREPIGIIPILMVVQNYDPDSLGPMASAMVTPYVDRYQGSGQNAGLSFTNNSKTVTAVSPPPDFVSQMEKGYVHLLDETSANPGLRGKIDTVESTTSLTLVDPWPGATESDMVGLIQWRWHDDLFYVWAQHYTAGWWARLLVF